MKNKYFIVGIIIALIFLNACDTVEGPYIKDNVTIWNGRKSVVFDFTGHKCGNCPRAHEAINELVEQYGEAVVPIAIHSTYYAKPASDTTKPFYYDFRTEIGDFLGGRDSELGYYGALYLPAGMVNSYSSEEFASPNIWGAKIAEVGALYPEFLISIDGNYNQDNNKINCDVKIETNIENSRKLSLTVFILEDHIIQWQKDYTKNPEDIPDYEHNHVLRGGFNGPFGEVVKDNNNSSPVGNIIEKSYSIDKKDDWKIENCLIVAFVYDKDSEEILQAETLHFNQ